MDTHFGKKTPSSENLQRRRREGGEKEEIGRR
jgi:hypothetical protein